MTTGTPRQSSKRKNSSISGQQVDPNLRNMHERTSTSPFDASVLFSEKKTRYPYCCCTRNGGRSNSRNTISNSGSNSCSRTHETGAGPASRCVRLVEVPPLGQIRSHFGVQALLDRCILDLWDLRDLDNSSLIGYLYDLDLSHMYAWVGLSVCCRSFIPGTCFCPGGIRVIFVIYTMFYLGGICTCMICMICTLFTGWDPYDLDIMQDFFISANKRDLDDLDHDLSEVWKVRFIPV